MKRGKNYSGDSPGKKGHGPRSLLQALKGQRQEVAKAKIEVRRLNGRIRELEDELSRRRLQLEVLGESGEHLPAIAESLQEGLLITDVHDVVLYMNNRMEELTGYRACELVGQKAIRLLLPSDQWETQLERNKKRVEGMVERYEIEIKRKDGNFIWLEISAAPFRNVDGKIVGTLGAHTDITLRKQLEEQLFQAQKMEGIGQLTTGIAHNFNNILMGSMGNLELALMDAPEVIKDYLQEAFDANQEAADLIKELMIFSRRTDVEKPLIDVGPIIKDVAEFCKVTFDRKIEIRLLNSADQSQVYGNVGQLKQMLLNFCINARDALEAVANGGHAPRIELGVETACLGDEDAAKYASIPVGDYIKVYVGDNGVGMDDLTQGHIFEPFFTTKDVGEGAGLGLATVYGIVRQHNAFIEVQSHPGMGSTFEVFLPVAKERRTAPRDGSREEILGGSETILIADDEERIRDAVSSALAKYGYEVLTASDGIECMDVFQVEAKKIDLVLLDVSMPKLSGREVLQKMIEIEAGIKVVIFTGYATDEDDFGNAKAFLQKPLRLPAVLKTVRRVLDM